MVKLSLSTMVRASTTKLMESLIDGSVSVYHNLLS